MLPENEIKELKILKELSMSNIRNLLPQISSIEYDLAELKEKLSTERKTYEKADRELAMNDIRFQVIDVKKISKENADKKNTDNNIELLKSLDKSQLEQFITMMEKQSV